MKKAKAPPLDLAWGAVLSRMHQMNIDMKKLAKITGYHYDTIRRTMSQPPIMWAPEQRNVILMALGLEATLEIHEASE